MLLGKSSSFKEILATDRREAHLVLAALYLLMLLPFGMVFARVAAEISADLLAAIFLYRSYVARDWQWLKRGPVVIALSFWAYSVLIVTPLAVEPVASLGRADWVRFIIFFAAITYWLSEYHAELKRIAYVLLGLLFLAGADGIYQYFTGASVAGTPYVQERLTGPFRKVVIGIFTAKLCLPLIGIALYYAWKENSRWLKILIPMLLIYFYVVVLLSNERTATLTFTLAMMVIAAGLFVGFKKARIYIAGLVIVGAIGLVAAFQTVPTLHNRLNVTKEILADLPSSQYMQLWKASILMWQQHPATGVGMVNFRIVCPELQAAQKVDFCSTHSHNLYLEVLSEMGSIGFTFMALLVLSIVIMVIENHRSVPKERIILTAFAIAGLILNFFPLAPTQSFFSNWPAFLAWQSVAWSVAIVKGGKKDLPDE